ncbi:MAG TPA: hypothetical protein ENI23_15955 [bacterium]|nr:hypothetical protein [bacterium]
MRLEQWFVSRAVGLFIPPEMSVSVVRGIVFEHPKFKDGTSVCTGPIVFFSSERMEISTRCGNDYKLGEIESGFVEYMEEIGQTIEDYDYSELN